MTIPLLVHGDGVEYLENGSLEVQSFGPSLATGESLFTLSLMCAYPCSSTVKPPKSKSKDGLVVALPRWMFSSKCSLNSCVLKQTVVLKGDNNVVPSYLYLNRRF
jgi:hypothetical protein